MSGLSYKEMVSMQRRILEYKNQLALIIGYIDPQGHRKLRKEHVLSGEVAAFKLVSVWHKRMLKDEEFLDREVAITLDVVARIIDLAQNGDFSDPRVIEDYEEVSMLLWNEVLKDREDQTLIETNMYLAILATIVDLQRGEAETFYKGLERADLYDSSTMCAVYSTVHDWIMSLNEEQFEKFVTENKLAKLLFDVF